MKEIIEEKGYSCDIIFTEYHGHATEIMSSLEEDVDLVISAGGDGTFNEVMTGNIKRKKRLLLAHLPVGTTNDVGAMMGYGKNIIENLKMTLNGVKKKWIYVQLMIILLCMYQQLVNLPMFHMKHQEI